MKTSYASAQRHRVPCRVFTKIPRRLAWAAIFVTIQRPARMGNATRMHQAYDQKLFEAPDLLNPMYLLRPSLTLVVAYVRNVCIVTRLRGALAFGVNSKTTFGRPDSLQICRLHGVADVSGLGVVSCDFHSLTHRVRTSCVDCEGFLPAEFSESA